MVLYDRLIAYPITFLILMALAVSALLMIRSVEFVNSPIDDIASIVRRLQDDYTHFPFTNLIATFGIIFMVLHAMAGIHGILSENWSYIFAYIIFTCILMVIQIVALYQLYSIVDDVLIKAGPRLLTAYIIYNQHMNEQNELHSIQEKYKCCGWDQTDDYTRAPGQGVKYPFGTCCDKEMDDKCVNHSQIMIALFRPPCSEPIKKVLNSSKVTAFAVLLVLYITQVTLLVVMTYPFWWWKLWPLNEVQDQSEADIIDTYE